MKNCGAGFQNHKSISSGSRQILTPPIEPCLGVSKLFSPQCVCVGCVWGVGGMGEGVGRRRFKFLSYLVLMIFDLTLALGLILVPVDVIQEHGGGGGGGTVGRGAVLTQHMVGGGAAKGGRHLRGGSNGRHEARAVPLESGHRVGDHRQEIRLSPSCSFRSRDG